MILNYEEIDGDSITPEDMSLIISSSCTNCGQDYDEDRDIMVAKLQHNTIWWHKGGREMGMCGKLLELLNK